MSDREALFIETLEKSGVTWGLGDDGVELGGLVYAMDSFVEGSHFRREWFSLESLAYKALAVNVSDIYAMNATPLYALLSLSIPPDFTPLKTRQLAHAVARACQAFNIKLIGGDTIRASLLGFTFTLLGKPHKVRLSRRGIRHGDIIVHTGRIGDSLQGLRWLSRGGRLASSHRFIKPTLRPQLLASLAPYLRAGMDISDGIDMELARLSRLNRVGFKWLKPLPKRLLCSGEEYEMLLALPPKNLAKAKRLAQKHRVALTILARAQKGRYKARCRGHHA